METFVRPGRVRYKNPWHKPGKPELGPEFYETDVKPKEYKGYLIYERISGVCWDVVKDGQAVTQRAGPKGARRYIDELVAGKNPV